MALFRNYYKQRNNLLSSRILVLIILCLAFLFRQNIYFSIITYRVAQEHITDTQLDAFLERYILTHPDVYDRHFDDIDKIVHVSLKLTADALAFKSEEDLKTDPLSTWRLGETNSEGFASFFNSVCTYLIQRYHFSEQYHCRQFVSERMKGNINLQDVIRSPYGGSSPFNKTREIVAIVDSKTGYKRFIDPVIYEQFNIVDINVVGENTFAGQSPDEKRISRLKRRLWRKP